MTRTQSEPRELPPVLIRITKADEGGTGTIAAPYLNPGMSAGDVDRLVTAARKDAPERDEIQADKIISRFLAAAGGALAGIGIVGTAIINSITGEPPIVHLDFSPPTIAIVGAAFFLIPAAVFGVRASATERRLNARTVTPRSVLDLTSLACIDRYGHYDDVEALILELQANRELATTLEGDGRDRAETALLEALPILNEYATTIKPSPHLHTSAHNAVAAVGIIARHERARS